MPEAPVLGGARQGAVKLDQKLFGVRFNEALVHESVRAEQAARRKGTAATRTRGMVSGGGAKPWRQKGTGRARAGSIRSPLWTGGGVVFGPQPRSYAFKVNRKERRAALRGALSLHAGRGSIAVLEPEVFGEPKTSQALEILRGWDQQPPTLVVLSVDESTAMLSFRNLRRVSVLSHEDLGVADVLAAASLIISRSALEALTGRLAAPKRSAATTTQAQSTVHATGAGRDRAAATGRDRAPATGSDPAPAAAPDRAPGTAPEQQKEGS